MLYHCTDLNFQCEVEIVRMDILVSFLIQGEFLPLFSIEYDVFTGFFFFFCEYPLSGWRSSLLLTLCWVFFFFKSQMDVRSFQMHLLRWTYGFSVSVYVGITLVDFWMPYQSFIPEINPTWSWCIVLQIWCWLWFLMFCWGFFMYINKGYCIISKYSHTGGWGFKYEYCRNT